MKLQVSTAAVRKALAATSCAYLQNILTITGSRRTLIIEDFMLVSETAAKRLAENDTHDGSIKQAYAFRSSIKNMSGTDDIKFTRLENLHVAVQAYFRTRSASRKGYVFNRFGHSAVCAYLVKEVVGPATTRYRDDANIRQSMRITASAVTYSGNTHSISSGIELHSFRYYLETNNIKYQEVLGKKEDKDSPRPVLDLIAETPVSLRDYLSSQQFYMEAPELHELYETQLSRFLRILPRFGEQFLVRGTSLNTSSSMLSEGLPSKCILDSVPKQCIPDSETQEDEDRTSRYRPRTYGASPLNLDRTAILNYSTKQVREFINGFSLDELQKPVKIFGDSTNDYYPVLPVLNIFHLRYNAYFTVHAVNLVPYKYKEDLSKNLVIPNDVKDLVEMLVANSENETSDIVDGKGNSTVICAIGDPGLGKTLLAEVMSEQCKRPLYKVEADQLGENASDLENNLSRILDLAQRWNCMVMIDEANAYVHERGIDHKQNGIVGVFLRKLEYFRGILVLTTNQTKANGDSFDIDPAILSRCSAVFTFELPKKREAAEIWMIQAKTMGIDLSNEIIKHLVDSYMLSGRSIRNLLKLASSWAEHRGEELSTVHFDKAIKFLPKTRNEAVKDAK
jgi:ATPase family associated with various cellular activities (AAA)